MKCFYRRKVADAEAPYKNSKNGENRGYNQDNVHGIYFGLLVEWLTDLTVQTVFGEMGRERDLGESRFLEPVLHSEESLHRTEPSIRDSSRLADLSGII